MYLIYLFLGITALFPSSSLSAPSNEHFEKRAGGNFQRCYTTLGTTTPAKSPTTQWKTYTTSCTATSTKLATTTITPSTTKTSIIQTIKTITAKSSTNTATVTAYTTSTSSTTLPPGTIVVNVVTTTSVVSTETNSITSVLASSSAALSTASAIPVKSSFPDSQYVSPNKKRNLDGFPAIQKRDGAQGTIPNAISCNTYTGQCRTSTTTSILTSTASTRTSTVSTTSTITVTVAKASTTTTSTSTITTVAAITPSSVVSTQTFVVTEVTSTSTFYLACATNAAGTNAVNSINGKNIIDFDDAARVSTYSTVGTNDLTAYDCCVSTLFQSLSVMFFFDPFQGCLMYTADFCPSNQDNTFNVVVADTLPENWPAALAVGNGYCGKYIGQLP